MTRRVLLSRAVAIAVLGWVALVLGGSPGVSAPTPALAPVVAATGAPVPAGSAQPGTAGPAGATPLPTIGATPVPMPGATPVPTGGATPTPTGSAARAAPTPTSTPGEMHPVNVGGVLFVSGVRTAYHRSWDPLGGSLHVELTIRNASTQVVDASASIGATTLLGIDLGGSDSIAVRGLDPGEIRTIGVDIGGIGQWGALKAHVTVTPPQTMAGVTLAPLTRDGWVVVPPWYLLALVVALVAVGWVFRHHRLVLAPRRGRRRRAGWPDRARPGAAFPGTRFPGTPPPGGPR